MEPTEIAVKCSRSLMDKILVCGTSAPGSTLRRAPLERALRRFF